MKPDGGAAFPHPLFRDHGPGMFLRDYFAAAALTGAMSNTVLLPSDESELQHLAMRVYQLADAMLTEREKP